MFKVGIVNVLLAIYTLQSAGASQINGDYEVITLKGVDPFAEQKDVLQPNKVKKVAAADIVGVRLAKAPSRTPKPSKKEKLNSVRPVRREIGQDEPRANPAASNNSYIRLPDGYYGWNEDDDPEDDDNIPYTMILDLREFDIANPTAGEPEAIVNWFCFNHAMPNLLFDVEEDRVASKAVKDMAERADTTALGRKVEQWKRSGIAGELLTKDDLQLKFPSAVVIKVNVSQFRTRLTCGGRYTPSLDFFAYVTMDMNPTGKRFIESQSFPIGLYKAGTSAWSANTNAVVETDWDVTLLAKYIGNANMTIVY